MKYLSVCSGIEAASVAWGPLGFEPVAFSEIDKFPAAVLAHHYPAIPNFGDMTKFKGWPDATFDILVGGTPCQSFSVAGLRKGLDDPRGNLMLTYLAIATKYRPAWVVWENVPGVLSSNGGRDFASFLRGLAELGYGFAYRILDAQYFGVPQRRRRVFVVGHLGDWRRAAAVLFERHSLQGHPAPSREKREGHTYPVAPCIGASGRGFERSGDPRGNDPVVAVHCPDIAHAATTHQAKGGDPTTDNYVTHSLRAGGFDASEDGTGRGTPLVPIGSFNNTGQGWWNESDTASSIRDMSAGGGSKEATVIAFAQNQRDEVRTMGVAGALASEPGMKQQTYTAFNWNAQASQLPSSDRDTSINDGLTVSQQAAIAFDCKAPNLGPSSELASTMRGTANATMAVRRLTPEECEFLQGFPRGYTLIQHTRGKPAADGPRYKALGNSMAVPVMRWIGERIENVQRQASLFDIATEAGK